MASFTCSCHSLLIERDFHKGINRTDIHMYFVDSVMKQWKMNITICLCVNAMTDKVKNIYRKSLVIINPCSNDIRK